MRPRPAGYPSRYPARGPRNGPRAGRSGQRAASRPAVAGSDLLSNEFTRGSRAFHLSLSTHYGPPRRPSDARATVTRTLRAEPEGPRRLGGCVLGPDRPGPGPAQKKRYCDWPAAHKILADG